MRRYESYKNSGINWVGDIPAHWKVCPGFTCFSENKDRNKSLAEKTVLSLSYGRIVVKPEEKMTGLVPESFENYQLIRPGDIVIRTTDLQNDQTSLRVGLAKDRGIITSAYLGLRSRDGINPEYLFRVLESYDALKVFYGLGSGLRQNIDFSDFKRLPIAVSSSEEQNRIVSFLKQKTAEVDVALSKKERLIELLREQRSVLIAQTVAHGLNCTVPLRDSGVAWLSAIPEHWEVKYLKHLFRESDQRSSSGSEMLLSLRMSGKLIPHNTVSDKPIAPEQLIGYKLVKPGQLVMNRMRASMGLFAVADQRGLVSPDYAIFDPITELLPSYYLQLFRNSAIKSVFLAESKGLGTGSSGFLRLYSDKFGGIKVPQPPIAEQHEISTRVENILSEFFVVESRIRREIEVLQEMRAATIAEVVTGKIRV